MLWGAAGDRRESGFWESGSKQWKSVQDLFRATSGSAGLDLSSTAYTVLTPEMGMQALPTRIYGPLSPETVGLLLGRSSTTMKGLHVAPGVIDADYTGEIKVMTHTPQGISVIPSGQRIAQLILLPVISVGRTVTTSPRKDGGFGSSEAYWIQEIKQNRPQLELKIQGKWFKGILDTGADVSCIADIHWPSAWPTQQTLTEL